jgi:hypothetical protein
MTHELELARERQRLILANAAQRREGRRALAHGRLIRQAERAERRLLVHADESGRLRARIAELESGI